MSASTPERPTVIAKIVGGLGNQLFCYAAARRMALRGDADLCLDTKFFRSDIYYGREYRLDQFPLHTHRVIQGRLLLPAVADTYWWRIKRKIAATGILPGADYLIERNPHEFDARLLSHKVTRDTYLDGYWQDERYFADIVGQLRAEFLMEPKLDVEQRKLLEQISSSNAVAVHTRRLQYIGLAGGDGPGHLAHSYYIRALDRIRNIVVSPMFFCFGDAPDWLDTWWPASIPKTVVHHSTQMGELIDLWLMTQCRHFIIANSTFSWWAAMLGRNPGKVVLTPRRQDLVYAIPAASGWIELEW